VHIQPQIEIATTLPAEVPPFEKPCQFHSSSPLKIVSLPPFQDALPLVQMYFADFNQFFPLFHESSFISLMAERYLSEAICRDKDPAWWASINVVLSMACRLRAMTPDAAANDDQRSMEYLQNASALAQGLMLYGSSLSTVQAVLGMAIIIHGTATPGCYAVLVAAVVRLTHMIGLNRQDQYDPALTPAEIEHQKRVFWIGYILDKDISFRWTYLLYSTTTKCWWIYQY
jgi:hypothetical protein